MYFVFQEDHLLYFVFKIQFQYILYLKCRQNFLIIILEAMLTDLLVAFRNDRVMKKNETYNEM